MNESLPAPARVNPRSKGKLIRAKITLLGSDPKIWRSFEVDSSLYLDEFHDVLQVMMGWEDSHLHSFTEHNPNTPGRRPSTTRSWAPVYVRAEDDDGWYDPEETVRVGKVLNEGSTPLFYEYDFGDGWTHRIDWVETVKKNSSDAHARVIRGKRRCPLEDSGGIGGYEHLLTTLANLDTVEETEREHAQWLHEWAQGTAQRSGGEENFDPGYFDLAAVNTNLEKLFTPDPGEERLGNL
ncbi:plasmid pRiA4b ORF-3 family protein [Arthrobacter flavus]|uniref:Plasmid pRiA4b ORF-3 family protein n=1 Tax=Arthrobacter flavus TaxID=95172 RepID=A0ABW4Q9V2_9MICC